MLFGQNPLKGLSGTVDSLLGDWESMPDDRLTIAPGTPQRTLHTLTFRPKFLTGSDGILLIRQEIIQSSISNYWQQGEQRIGLGLQRSRLWHLLKAWGGVFRFQPIGHACSTG